VRLRKVWRPTLRCFFSCLYAVNSSCNSGTSPALVRSRAPNFMLFACSLRYSLLAERLAPEAPSALSEQNLALIRSLSCPCSIAVRSLVAQQPVWCLQKLRNLSVQLDEPTCMNMLSTTAELC
jgi:hypothetical protein